MAVSALRVVSVPALAVEPNSAPALVSVPD